MLIESLKKLLDLLSRKERRQAFLLFGMVLIMALLDMAGIASIMPFLSVLANPDVVETNRYLASIYHRFGYSDPGAFLYFLGLMVFVLLIVSISFKALTHYFILRFTHMRNYSISRRLVVSYLQQPYEWFLNRHSADLAKTVLSEVEQVILVAMLPAIHLIAHGATAVVLVILLLAVNPWLTIIMTAVLGGLYGLIYVSLRSYLLRIGTDRLHANEARFTTVQESFGGIKEVKIGGFETEFIKRFDGPANRYAKHQATAGIAGNIPRYVLEGIAFGGMFLVILFLMKDSGGLQEALPLIGLYALASYRLLPALQQMYAHLANLRYAKPALDALHSDIQMLRNTAGRDQKFAHTKPLLLKNRIKLEHVTYCYPGAERPSLADVSLEVRANTTVGIVGSSGAGKTTAVDVILGLLWPGTGKLLVDEIMIDAHNVRAWQRSIGYVPQQIYLSDASLAANIAFGLPEDQIDLSAVEEAARIANLHDYIIADLPEGYATKVGERGVRLSGGQRQRIGIARALYNNPELLILDEATSALDNLTEKAVMDAVSNLAHQKTIIIIAHRLSTVRTCDEIIMLDQGRLEGKGTFEGLAEDNHRFRAMTEAHD